MRESLAITLGCLPLVITLVFIAQMMRLVPRLSPSDPNGMLLISKALAARGMMPMIGVALSELACYFNPTNKFLRIQQKFLSGFSLYVACLYLLLVPLMVSLFLKADLAKNPLESLYPDCLISSALAIGYLGAARIRGRQESPLQWVWKKIGRSL